MNYRFALTILILLSTYQVFGYGLEDVSDTVLTKKVKLDEEGFEIVSSTPSKAVLESINSNYLKNIKKIFLNKCLSCHGVSNSPPWYYNLPMVKQLIDSDMTEAKKAMDMSHDFPFIGHGSPKDDLRALHKTIKKGNMPPAQYRIMHWRSQLTEIEVKLINDWIKGSLQLLDN